MSRARPPLLPRGFALRPFLRDLAAEFGKDHVFDVAAELAFWSLLAVFPFLILVLTLIGYLPLHQATAELTATLYRVMPEQAAALVDQTLHEVLGRQRGLLLLVALVGSLWSASGGVSATMNALNRAYDVPDRPSYLRAKLLSIGLTLVAALFTVLATLAVLVAPALTHHLRAWLALGPAFRFVWPLVRWSVALASMLFTLACLYYYLPNVKNNRFRFITPGAVVAVGGWILASLLFNAYVSHFGVYAKTYGTLGAAVVLLLWLYITGLMIVTGGEINALLDRHVLAEEHEPKAQARLRDRWRALVHRHRSPEVPG